MNKRVDRGLLLGLCAQIKLDWRGRDPGSLWLWAKNSLPSWDYLSSRPPSFYWICWPFNRQFNCSYKRIQTAKPIPPIPKPRDGDEIGFYPSSCFDKIPEDEHYQWPGSRSPGAQVLLLCGQKMNEMENTLKNIISFLVSGFKLIHEHTHLAVKTKIYFFQVTEAPTRGSH